jgi:hypothetical protein
MMITSHNKDNINKLYIFFKKWKFWKEKVYDLQWKINVKASIMNLRCQEEKKHTHTHLKKH